MVFLGFGKWARADKIYALQPITGGDRGHGLAAVQEQSSKRDVGHDGFGTLRKASLERLERGHRGGGVSRATRREPEAEELGGGAALCLRPCAQDPPRRKRRQALTARRRGNRRGREILGLRARLVFGGLCRFVVSRNRRWRHRGRRLGGHELFGLRGRRRAGGVARSSGVVVPPFHDRQLRLAFGVCLRGGAPMNEQAAAGHARRKQKQGCRGRYGPAIDVPRPTPRPKRLVDGARDQELVFGARAFAVAEDVAQTRRELAILALRHVGRILGAFDQRSGHGVTSNSSAATGSAAIIWRRDDFARRKRLRAVSSGTAMLAATSSNVKPPTQWRTMALACPSGSSSRKRRKRSR